MLARAGDSNNDTLSGAKWYFYATGTTTPQAVYTTSALSVAHANPVVADSAGKFSPIYMDSTKTYRGVLKTSDDATTIFDIDPINDAALQQLAATTSGNGAALVGAKRQAAHASTWATAKTVLDHLFEHSVSILETGAVQDFDHAAGTGTDNSSTAFDNMLADAKVGAIFIPPGDLGFKFTKSISLKAGQRLIGAPDPSSHSQSKANPRSKIAFRPSGADVVAIKNGTGVEGCGVQDLLIDMNGATHTAMQFTGSYSNIVRHVHLAGTYKWGVVMHETYVSEIDGLYTAGAAVHGGAIFIGTFNAINIANIHTSNLPQTVGDVLYGICVNGAGAGLTIHNAVMQGQTIGIHVGASAKGVTIMEPYFENSLCNIRLGSSSSGPLGVNIIGGAYGHPYSSHSQYASRGPVIYARAGTGVKLHASRWDSAAAPADVNGPWPIVAGSALFDIEVGLPSIFGANDTGAMLMREAAGNNTSFLLHSRGSSHSQRELLMKCEGNFASNGFRMHLSSAGAWVAAAYQPTVIPAAVSTLLQTAEPAATAVVV